MNVAAEQTIPTIGTVDDHRVVKQHAKQLSELAEKQAAIRATLVSMNDRRARLASARQQEAVERALGISTGAFDMVTNTARLAALDIDIREATLELDATNEVVQRLTTIAVGVREQVAAELSGQVEAAAATALAQMLPLAERLVDLNRQLIALAANRPGMLVPDVGLLVMWSAMARSVAKAIRR